MYFLRFFSKRDKEEFFWTFVPLDTQNKSPFNLI